MELTKPEIVAACGVLLSVIGALFTRLVYAYNKNSDRAERYEKDHKECLEANSQLSEGFNKEIIELTAKYNYLEGRMSGVEQLSKNVLDEINKHSKG